MDRWKMVLLAVAIGAMTACFLGCSDRSDLWYDSDLPSALAEAGDRGTLARLLYLDGRVDEAIEIESRAAEDSDGQMAENFAAAVEIMRCGADLGDRPEFEEFPGMVN